VNNTFPSYDQVEQARATLRDLAHEHWAHHDFLTWKWSLLVFFTVVPWFIWWRIADNKRLHELLLYGGFVAIGTVIVDNIGTELLRWGFPDKLLQMVPPLFPADITLVPVFMMIGYQIARTWRSFVLVNIVLGVFMAYVGEPLFVWLDFYSVPYRGSPSGMGLGNKPIRMTPSKGSTAWTFPSILGWLFKIGCNIYQSVRFFSNFK